MAIEGDDIVIRLSLKDIARFHADAKAADKDIEGLGKTTRKTSQELQYGSTGLSAFSRGIRGVLGIGAAAVAGVAAVGAAVVAVGVKLYRAGSDAFETHLKYKQVFKDLTPQVDAFIKTTNQKFAVPTKELEDATSLFAIFGESAGVARQQLPSFSTELVQAGEDLASFHNVDVQTVFKAIQSGLAGMIRPLRQYGIFLSDAAIKQEAVSMGLIKAGGSQAEAQIRLDNLSVAQAKYNRAVSKYGEHSIQAQSANVGLERAQNAIDKAAGKVNVSLTDQQKILARQHFIIRNLGDANGDLARTITSPANQMRMFRNRMLEISRTLGSALLPGINAFVQILNKGLAGALQWIGRNTVDWGIRIQRALELVRIAFQDASAAFRRGGWHAMAQNLDESVGASGRVKSALERVRDVFDDVRKIIRDGVIPTIKDVKAVVVDFAGPTVLGAAFLSLHLVAQNANALHRVLELLLAMWILNKAAVIGLTIAQGIYNVRAILGAIATDGLAGAQWLAAMGAKENAVWCGVLSGVLNSALVKIVTSSAAWVWHTTVLLADAAADLFWQGVAGISLLYDQAIALTTSAGIWLWHTGAVLADAAADLFWQGVAGLGVLAEQGVTLAITTAAWIGHAVAVGFDAVVMGVAATATWAWQAAQWALNIAMEANPIGLVVVAIALLVAGVILAYRRVGWFRAAVDGTFRFLRTVVVTTVNFVREHWKLIVAVLLGPFALAALLITEHFNTIKRVVVGVINWVIDQWNAFASHLAIHIKGPSWLGSPHFDFDPGKTLQINHLHSGGITTSAGLVNIRPDEEVVMLPPAASVIPLPRNDGPTPSFGAMMDRRPVVAKFYWNSKMVAEAVGEAVSDNQARK